MAIHSKSLALNDSVAGTTAGTADTLYTATNVEATITAFTAHNSHGAAVEVFVYILPSGVAATAVDPIAVQSVAAGSTAIISHALGHTVPKKGSIAAYAGTTAVIRLTASGCEQST